MSGRALVLAALLGGARPAAAQDAPSGLDLARAEAEAYPEDAAAQVAWAEAAARARANEEALTAWRTVASLAGDDPTNRRARLDLLLRLDRPAQAVALAQAWRREAPDDPEPLRWAALAARSRGDLPALRATLARARYRRAARLDPDDPIARCGLGWTRAALGDRLGARRAFAAAAERGDAVCATAGRAATAPALRSWGRLRAVAHGWQGHPERRLGGSGVMGAGLGWGDLVAFEATGRLIRQPTRFEGVEDPLPFDQREVWLRGVVGHAGHGVELLTGLLGLEGPVSGRGTFVSGRAWTTAWITLTADGGWARHADGWGWHLGGDLAVPLGAGLSLSAGVGTTALTPDEGATLSETGRPLVAGRAVATWRHARLTAWGGGRVGPEIRPLRLDEPSVYNLDDRLIASGLAGVRVRIDDLWQVEAGYDVSRVRPADGSPDRHLHLGHLGLVIATDLATRPRPEAP